MSLTFPLFSAMLGNKLFNFWFKQRKTFLFILKTNHTSLKWSHHLMTKQHEAETFLSYYIKETKYQQFQRQKQNYILYIWNLIRVLLKYSFTQKLNFVKLYKRKDNIFSMFGPFFLFFFLLIIKIFQLLAIISFF